MGVSISGIYTCLATSREGFPKIGSPFKGILFYLGYQRGAPIVVKVPILHRSGNVEERDNLKKECMVKTPLTPEHRAPLRSSWPWTTSPWGLEKCDSVLPRSASERVSEVSVGMFQIVLTVLTRGYYRGVLQSLLRAVCIRGNMPRFRVSGFGAV